MNEKDEERRQVNGDLGSKYLSHEDRNPESPATRKQGGQQGGSSLAVGIGLGVLGIILTARSQGSFASSNRIYYGLVFVGASLIFEGIYLLAKQTSYQFMPKAVRVACWVGGFVVSMIFMVCCMK